ncbi:MAG TPA: hypothetical protein VFS43_24010 [Polyangiaceae bacterium]|nr:hypothetical protein [Polyangiaceae bacterium]
MRPTPVVEVVYLGEDKSEQTGRALRRIIEHMFTGIRPTLNLGRVKFTPSTAEERRALHGNAWEGKGAAHAITLCRSIATRLLEPLVDGVPRFVLFHYDGDEVWSKRHESDRHEKFDRLVRVQVKRNLLARAAGHTVHPKGYEPSQSLAPFGPEKVDLFLGRIVEIVPFYCIETWLYHNFKVAKAKCREHCGGRHVVDIESWEANSPTLDEVDSPKEKLCFQDRCNADLAGAGFPVDDLYCAGTSFYETFERLRQNADLVEALERTERS